VSMLVSTAAFWMGNYLYRYSPSFSGSEWEVVSCSLPCRKHATGKFLWLLVGWMEPGRGLHIFSLSPIVQGESLVGII